MRVEKILDEQIQDLKIASLPTRPTADRNLGGRGFTQKEMKEAFDKLPLLIIKHFNDLLEDICALGEDSVAAAIRTGLPDITTLAELFLAIQDGRLANQLSVSDKSLTSHMAQITERLSMLEGRMEDLEQDKI